MRDQPKRDELMLDLDGQLNCLLVPYDLNEGDSCPHCAMGQLNYNGLLDLVCDRCGFELCGVHT